MNKEPFNLNKFMSGQPALTRAGSVAYFVAFVPESEVCSQLVYRVGVMVWLADSLGRVNSGLDAAFDLTHMASPYHDFEIDEPVMVMDYNCPEWRQRHFAGLSVSGRPQTWAHGTRWASMGGTHSWDVARRPTPEELEGGE